MLASRQVNLVSPSGSVHRITAPLISTGRDGTERRVLAGGYSEWNRLIEQSGQQIDRDLTRSEKKRKSAYEAALDYAMPVPNFTTTQNTPDISQTPMAEVLNAPTKKQRVGRQPLQDITNAFPVKDEGSSSPALLPSTPTPNAPANHDPNPYVLDFLNRLNGSQQHMVAGTVDHAQAADNVEAANDNGRITPAWDGEDVGSISDDEAAQILAEMNAAGTPVDANVNDMGNAGLNDGNNRIDDDEDNQVNADVNDMDNAVINNEDGTNAIDDNDETAPKFERVKRKLIETVIFKEPFAVDAYEVVKNLWETMPGQERLTKGRQRQLINEWTGAITTVLKTVCKLLPGAYALQPQRSNVNRDAVLKLMAQMAFAYKDLDARTGAYRHPLIAETLKAILSTDSSADIDKDEWLRDGIPLPTIAFAMVMIEQGLDEWRWGYKTPHNKVKLTDLPGLKGRYNVHLEVLVKFSEYTQRAISQTLLQDTLALVEEVAEVEECLLDDDEINKIAGEFL